MSPGLRFAREIMGLAPLTNEWAIKVAQLVVTLAWIEEGWLYREVCPWGYPHCEVNARSAECVVCPTGS